MASKTDWIFYLLIFNFIIVTAMGFYGSTFDDDVLSNELQTPSLVPDFVLNIVTGFENTPAWLNGLLGLQLVLFIWIVASSILPSGT